MSRRVILIILVLIMATDARALVVCQRRSGQLVSREACKRRESRVVLDTIVPPGPPGRKGDAGMFPVRLTDAKGVEFGRIVSLRGFVGTGTEFAAAALVTHSLLAGPVLFNLHNDGSLAGQLYYQSSNCTGQPYVQGGTYLTAAQVLGGVVYYGTMEGAVVTTGSVERTGPTCAAPNTPRATCCVASVGQRAIRFATTIPLADLGFTPPFAGVRR